MNNKKMTLILALAFVLILGGAGILYKQLGQELTPDLLSSQTPAETEYTEASSASPQETEYTEASSANPQETEYTEASSANPQETESGKKLAPDFTVYDLDGKEVHLSDYIGKPIVLNFWASWCGPCKMEMPDFNRKFLELDGEVQFLLINMTDGSRETVETASAFITDQGYSFPVFYDTGQDAAISYSVYSLPATYFIDDAGCVIAQATGTIDRQTLQQGIDMILSDD